jgi:hypothetical protein
MDLGKTTLATDSSRGRYKISLRFWHPHMPPEEMATGLGLTPTICQKAGDPRKAPQGLMLPGDYPVTYCVFPISGESCHTLVDDIASFVSVLEQKAAFFESFHNTGGTSELFVGWFERSGETIPWELMGRLAALNVNVGLDVYGS